MKPWKQRIQSTFSAETDLKSLVAEAIAAAMDASEVTKKTKQAKRVGEDAGQIFRQVNGQTHTPFDQ